MLTWTPCMKEVENFAMTDYATALLKGRPAAAAERTRIIDRMHNYTGLSKEYLDQCNLRLEVGRFNKELLRSEGKTVGRLDSRITGYDYDNAAKNTNTTPATIRPFTGRMPRLCMSYMHRTLKYDNPLPYEVLTGRPRPWPMASNKYLNVAETCAMP